MGVTGESSSTYDRLRLAGEDAGGVIGFILAVVGFVRLLHGEEVPYVTWRNFCFGKKKEGTVEDLGREVSV